MKDQTTFVDHIIGYCNRQILYFFTQFYANNFIHKQFLSTFERTVLTPLIKIANTINIFRSVEAIPQ